MPAVRFTAALMITNRNEVGYAFPDNAASLLICRIVNRLARTRPFMRDIEKAESSSMARPFFAVEVRRKNDYGAKAGARLTEARRLFCLRDEVFWGCDVLPKS